MLVIDASVLTVALADDGPDGDHARRRIRGERLVAPELIDLEVTSAFRGHVRGGVLDRRRADLAMDDLASMPMRRVSHRPVLPRCWELRDNVTPYDAAYVALAEMLQVILLTGDGRLARFIGPRCRIEVIGPHR